MDIDGFALVLTHEAYGILDMTEAALAEHIVFVKAEVLGVIHIEVGDWESFGHHLQCRVIGDGTFGYEDTTGMDGEIVGKTLDHLAVAEDVFGIGVMFVIGQRGIDYRVDIGFGEADDFAEFADDGAAFERVVGRE